MRLLPENNDAMLRRVISGIVLLLVGIAVGSWGSRSLLPAWAVVVPSAGDVNCDGRLNLSDPVLLLNYLFTGGAAPIACPPHPQPTLAPKTVVLVRHAEKSTSGGEGAHLTDRGRLEAEKLREIFADVSVDFIAASATPRTIETVEPLANRDPANPIPIAQFGDIGSYDGLIDFVNATPPGSLTVIAHHSTTIRGILGEMGAAPAQISTINTSAYNNLIVLFLQDGGPTMVLPMRGQDFKAFPVFYFGPPK